MTVAAASWYTMNRVEEAIDLILEGLLMANEIVRREKGLKYRRGGAAAPTALEPIPPAKPGDPPAFKSRFDSRCLICGHIHYKQMRLKCSRCKGHCRIMLPDELALSARYSLDNNVPVVDGL